MWKLAALGACILARKAYVNAGYHGMSPGERAADAVSWPLKVAAVAADAVFCGATGREVGGSPWLNWEERR